MTRGLRTAVCCAVLLLTALLCGWSPRSASSWRELTEDPLERGSRIDLAVGLPDGFTATLDRATSDQVVRVVADDVDRDGDVDVVASLDSLDLAVWKNDGAGHFTRQPSSRHLALQTQPPAPSVDGDPLTSNEWIQDGQPRGADLEPTRERRADDPEIPFSPIVRTATDLRGVRVRSTRAPPIA
jgi:hypothetical protein